MKLNILNFKVLYAFFMEVIGDQFIQFLVLLVLNSICLLAIKMVMVRL